MTDPRMKQAMGVWSLQMGEIFADVATAHQRVTEVTSRPEARSRQQGQMEAFATAMDDLAQVIGRLRALPTSPDLDVARELAAIVNADLEACSIIRTTDLYGPESPTADAITSAALMVGTAARHTDAADRLIRQRYL